MFSSKICNIKKINKNDEKRRKVEVIKRGKEEKEKEMDISLYAELAIIKAVFFSILINNAIF